MSVAVIPRKESIQSRIEQVDWPNDFELPPSYPKIASKKQEDAGPTNNWIDPGELKPTMKGLYDACMKGRNRYIIPFSMGPIGSKFSKICTEIADSPDVVVNTRTTNSVIIV